MTCKDCIRYKACDIVDVVDIFRMSEMAELCESFKADGLIMSKTSAGTAERS